MPRADRSGNHASRKEDLGPLRAWGSRHDDGIKLQREHGCQCCCRWPWPRRTNRHRRGGHDVVSFDVSTSLGSIPTAVVGGSALSPVLWRSLPRPTPQCCSTAFFFGIEKYWRLLTERDNPQQRSSTPHLSSGSWRPCLEEATEQFQSVARRCDGLPIHSMASHSACGFKGEGETTHELGTPQHGERNRFHVVQQQ